MSGWTSALPKCSGVANRLKALAVTLAVLLATPAGAAEVLDDDEPEAEASRSELEFSANVSLTSDYVFRGVSQTDQSPAIQGGFDVDYRGLYLGVWGSNVDLGGDTTPSGETVDVANVEIDFFGGIKRSYNGVEFELGMFYYHYPNAYDPEGDLDYYEYKGGLSGKLFQAVDAGIAFLYSPNYSGNIGKTFNVEGTFKKAVGRGFEAGGALGYFWSQDRVALLADGRDEYWYWNAGVSKTFNEKFTFDFRYWDTNGRSDDCKDAAVLQCSWRVVGKLTAAF